MARDEDPQRPQSRADDIRVNLDDESKRAYWVASLGVSEDELRRAIAEVGPAVREIRLFLGRCQGRCRRSGERREHRAERFDRDGG